jgi:hypothetical protein
VASRENKRITNKWKLEIVTPLGNINLNKIFQKIECMFMKQRCGHAFQLVKGCFVLTCVKRYELNEEVSNIAMHGQGEKANVPKFMFSWIFV